MILQYMVVTLKNNIVMYTSTWNNYINSHLWSVTLHRLFWKKKYSRDTIQWFDNENDDYYNYNDWKSGYYGCNDEIWINPSQYW